MKESLVLISLEEYNELLKIKEEFTNAFFEKKLILNCSYMSAGPTGHIPRYSIVNETEIIESLNNELGEYKERCYEISQSNRRLQDAFLNKKWFEYIPKRKWYELLPMR